MMSSIFCAFTVHFLVLTTVIINCSSATTCTNTAKNYTIEFYWSTNCTSHVLAQLKIWLRQNGGGGIYQYPINSNITVETKDIGSPETFSFRLDCMDSHVGFQWSFNTSLEETCCWSVNNPKIVPIIVPMNDQASTNIEICYQRQAYISTNEMLWTCYSNLSAGVGFQSSVYIPRDPNHGTHDCKNNTDDVISLTSIKVATEPSNGISTMITEFTPSSIIPISPSTILILSSSIPMSPSSIPMSSSSILMPSSLPMTITNTSTSTTSTSTSSTQTSTTSSPMSTTSTQTSITSSTSSSSSSSITVEPTSSASIDLMCNATGVWPLTKAGSNVTISGVCYNGTVDAIRICDLKGNWSDYKCLPTKLFIGTYEQILESPEDGINTLSQNISLRSSEISVGQFIFLLNAVLKTVLLSTDNDPIETIFAKEFLEISNDVILNSNLELDEEKRRSAGSQLIMALDILALNLVEPSEQVLNISDNIFLMVSEFDQPQNSNIIGISKEDNSITLPPLILGTDITKPVRIGSFFFRNLSILLPPRNASTSIITPVISSTTNCRSCPVTNLTENVTIQLRVKNRATSDNITCVFFKFDDQGSGDWNTSGCTTVINGDIVTCSCNHLTHFAILLSPGIEIDPIHYDVLTIIGLVLVPISLLCMIIVILTYTFMRSLWSIRNYIHIMLCVSLFMAQLVFIIGVDKIKNEGACSAVAVLLQYLFLVTFMWMLMEGVVLYVTLVRVFIHNHKNYIIAFTVASYVIPAVYMVVIVPIGFLVKVGEIPGHTHFLYYSEDRLTACWLSYESSFIWSFIVPVAIILMVNIGFFIMAIVIMKKHAKKLKDRGKSVVLKHWLKASISLTLVMGITWLAGLLAFRRELLFVAYIMTIFIAGQGLLLFIILVPFSKEVREAYKKVWLRQKSQSVILTKLSNFTTPSFFSTNTMGKTSTLSNSTNGKSNGNIGGIKLGTFGPGNTSSLTPLVKNDDGSNTLQSIKNGSNDSGNYTCVNLENNIYESNPYQDTPMHLAVLIDKTYDSNSSKDTLMELIDKNYEVDPKLLKQHQNDVIISNDQAILEETSENNLYETVGETVPYETVVNHYDKATVDDNDYENGHDTCD